MSAATVAMVEEKARVVLARSERAALSQLIADYRTRRLNIEELVVSLGELLNTHEKLTLLTELRELVDSKDRAIFDDLVYRPRATRVTIYSLSLYIMYFIHHILSFIVTHKLYTLNIIYTQQHYLCALSLCLLKTVPLFYIFIVPRDFAL